MPDIETLLEMSSRNHDHLCPRQILGVRIGLAGLKALGFSEPPARKRLLTILETDGCFADGVMAATLCSVGHRTLRIEDYGKAAASFVDCLTGRAVRVAPALDIRDRALACAPEEPRHYFAQMKAYRVLPDERMLTITEVQLETPLEKIMSRRGVRVNCAICGEEIMNEREIEREGMLLCRACAGLAYLREPMSLRTLELNWSEA